MISLYIVPFILNFLGFLSLRGCLLKVPLPLKLLILMSISLLSVFSWFFAHTLSKGMLFPSFRLSDFLASLILCVINTVALWVFIKLKKD